MIAPAPNPHAAAAATEISKYGVAESVPGDVCVREHHNGSALGDQHGADPRLTGRSADGIEKVVLVFGSTAPLDHHDPMPPFQIMAERLGAGQRAVLIRPGE